MQLLIIRDLSQNREQFCRAFDAERQVHFRKSADLFFRNAALCADQQCGVKQKQPACAAAVRCPEKAAEIISAAVSLLIGKHLPATPALFQNRCFLRGKCSDLLYHIVETSSIMDFTSSGSNAVQEIPRSAETSRSEEATPETAAPETTATPAPTPEPTPAVVVPTSVTLEQEGGILNNGMTWTLHATVLPEDAADKTITWTSADESVATIDDSGVITTHAPGQTTITAASTAGGVSTTYNLVVQEVVKCSYCGGTGHTADTCAVKKTAEQQAATVAAQQQAAAQAAAAQAAEQPAAEAAQPADPGYEVDWAGRRIYYQGDADIPEGGVVQRPDGSRYIKGPRCVIFGYDTCPEDTDPSLPGNTPFTGDCVFCGEDGHDVYSCPYLDELENSEAYQELLQNNG